MGPIVPVTVLVTSSEEENKTKKKCRAQGQPLSCGFFRHGVAWLPERLASSLSYSHWCLSPERWMPSPSSSSPDHLHTLAHNDGGHWGPSAWQLILSSPPPALSQTFQCPPHPLQKKSSRPLSWTCHREIRSSVRARGSEGHRSGLWVRRRWTCYFERSGGLNCLTATFIYSWIVFAVQRSFGHFFYYFNF